ncbi:hypothetical protein [Shewanella sp. 10N.286.51.B7]|uniref:hypothetical protein n=1 Tax=Shewanella sp. 10N.286.51.B7 TaxID=1880836 RepID=UPI001F53D8FE|nr:hypothetical protein [Shewanella sp. 10N.286.51.B7]
MESGIPPNSQVNDQVINQTETEQRLATREQQIDNLIVQQLAKKPWYQNPEMIVAFSALVIGIVTTFTSIYSAAIDRAYARASVWPSVEIARGYGYDSFRYIVSNNGTGPAVIKYAKVTHDKKYLSQWRDINVFEEVTQSHIGKTVLSAQKTITPVLYKGNKVDDILKVDNLISIELCYCSIYDECWIVNRDNNPMPIEQCVIDDKHKFLQ